jgi:hypothetical protein
MGNVQNTSIILPIYAKSSENKYKLCIENHINRQAEYLYGRVQTDTTAIINQRILNTCHC